MNTYGELGPASVTEGPVVGAFGIAARLTRRPELRSLPPANPHRLTVRPRHRIRVVI